ncbi:MAG TPA: sugar phosphate isomerase/epimerase family protein [Steroidobacteraceae bacterium]|nr:sugar phosphate isomerase/epimerase family protein [Steroidobacteraceae bacterium]
MTQPVQILGSFWTLAVGADPLGDQRCHHDFRSRVETAARAGFTALGLWHTDLAEILKKYPFPEMKRILDGNGITQIEVEWLLDWYCSDHRRAVSDQTRQLLLEAAEQLQAHHIKIGDLGNDCAEVPRLAEEFGILCEQAARRGTKVLFEMLPAQFSRAPSLEQVLAIVRGSGATNGGIMLDNLHLQRIGTPLQDIVKKIGRDVPIGVEINDGMLAAPRKFEDSVVNKRLLPGDGEFDITAFLHAVWTWGYDGPIGVEVLNEYIRKWSLETAARESFDKTTRVVAAARESWEAGRKGRS